MERQYHLFDANNKVLGRLSTEVAKILSGKNKVDYTPHIDDGDAVVIINADKIKLTGNKETDKKYYSFSGYHGGITEKTVKELREENASEIIRKSVVGMLPKNKLGRQMQKRLFIYNNDEHTKQIHVEHA
ncbi:MAG: 50S ribosomal protein L13 [Candidatus Moraniibacteriota bacterium]|nr:MAG: 50S ribosomal protein L13 [Candidatus Moranbacteria bacterium]